MKRFLTQAGNFTDLGIFAHVVDNFNGFLNCRHICCSLYHLKILPAVGVNELQPLFTAGFRVLADFLEFKEMYAELV